MSSHMKGKIIKIISPNYIFLPANPKLRQICKFANECFLYDARTEGEVVGDCNTPIFSDA